MEYEYKIIDVANGRDQFAVPQRIDTDVLETYLNAMAAEGWHAVIDCGTCSFHAACQGEAMPRRKEQIHRVRGEECCQINNEDRIRQREFLLRFGKDEPAGTKAYLAATGSPQRGARCPLIVSSKSSSSAAMWSTWPLG